jgi:hypothetical protein
LKELILISFHGHGKAKSLTCRIVTVKHPARIGMDSPYSLTSGRLTGCSWFAGGKPKTREPAE